MTPPVFVHGFMAGGVSGVLPSRFETIETSKIRAKTDGVCATARHTGNRRKPPRRDTELRRSSGSGHTRPFVTLGRQVSKVSASRHPLQISTMHPKFTGLVAFDRIS
jgi:hypothetical protein